MMTNTVPDNDVDFETAVGDPAAYYPDPAAIAADTTLSKAQKQRFLNEWAHDLADRQVADSEGMAPGDGTSSTDAALLKQVNAAIEQVETAADAEPAGGVRGFWTRLKAIID
jgi:hypothetical protein